MKTIFKAGNMIYPLPAVLVSCGNKEQGYNILTIAWTGTICSSPAMCYISVRPERFSHHIIKENGDFFINLTNRQLAFATDWCGVKSGKDTDKFKSLNLTPMHCSEINAPYIKESPLSIACKVKEIIPLGSHDMFIADVVNILADNMFISPKTGSFNLEQADLISYCHGKYYTMGKPIGKFGWSVEKKKRKK
ncbi:MAG: flavin reductase family protein [Bacteroidales bacterium]|nr:flavin reductase family protein [Bacteroidales bacterium]